jgi:hypothetical protein
MIINIVIKNIPNQIEKKLISLINFKPYKCYNEISKNELLKFEAFYNINKDNNINKEMFISLRNACIRLKMINKHHILIENKEKIIKDYVDNKIDILKISTKYDGSPLNILRIVFSDIYPKISLKILLNNNNKSLLQNHDRKQFLIAINYDKFAVINQDEMHKESMLFEKDIEKLLIKNNIKYKTQDTLSNEQIKKYGKSICTPDFLILSQLVINGIDIKWIDAKNFYGSNNRFVINSIKKQTEKYIKSYGSGAVIFKLGCNEKLLFDKILCFDYNLLTTIEHN